MIFKTLAATLLVFSSLSQGDGNLPETGNDYAISPFQIQKDNSVIISERSLDGRRLLEKSFGEEVNVRFHSPSLALSQEDIVQRLDGDYVASDDEKILNNDSNANNNSSAEPCPDNSWVYAVCSVLGLGWALSCTGNCYQYKKNVSIKNLNIGKVTVNNNNSDSPCSQQTNSILLAENDNDSPMLSSVIKKKKGESTEIEKRQYNPGGSSNETVFTNENAQITFVATVDSDAQDAGIKNEKLIDPVMDGRLTMIN